MGQTQDSQKENKIVYEFGNPQITIREVTLEVGSKSQGMYSATAKPVKSAAITYWFTVTASWGSHLENARRSVSVTTAAHK